MPPSKNVQRKLDYFFIPYSRNQIQMGKGMHLGNQSSRSEEQINPIEKHDECRSSALSNWYKIRALVDEDSRTAWKQNIIYNLRRR